MRPYAPRIIADDPIYRDIPSRSGIGILYCADVCGCSKAGWRDPTGFLKMLYLNYIYVDI